MSLNSKKPERIKFLCDKINVKISDINDSLIQDLRYQLFHRIASAVIMAEKLHSKSAVMLVQSFVSEDKTNHFNDYKKFITDLYNIENVEKNKLFLLSNGDVNIYSGLVETLTN